MLSTIKWPTLPNDAVGVTAWFVKLSLAVQPVDITKGGLLTRSITQPQWWPTHPELAAGWFHTNHKGLAQLDRFIASTILTEANFKHPVHDVYFSNYSRYCLQASFQPMSGRALIAIVCMNFRVDRI